ncbi:hypothetical protein A2662_01785 [Candidatus Giovannonibacteria bacterium RIFCSPHIGHO2_01_FULL_45_33]|uniref:Uncharacterized protein n=1 Tax=Candidatus Giovannonibacteria bacterium RIFCSPLOWO2_01_FULL_45_34 TaxID=1798351 RepID=A0A1F5WYR3_9BACT|nr:MAG: hypothetical protein A2662_01785 [Candidatus Giovannonibacteria bacterium RIFCSPHIGHO2_01_FULL_45_33]OGF71005.1 MAG: hypothetical protein A3C73_04260 [Candidatus Giovannonibacteria bacterium RIFCSPHIGHO2_02_FULL_44_11]OGF80796.1 MAG: hypothetical protein A2930_01550 [Candidatus Giovannonibacteria bacterium RIFCSPLOWO2_01_FULL_45_34]
MRKIFLCAAILASLVMFGSKASATPKQHNFEVISSLMVPDMDDPAVNFLIKDHIEATIKLTSYFIEKCEIPAYIPGLYIIPRSDNKVFLIILSSKLDFCESPPLIWY